MSIFSKETKTKAPKEAVAEYQLLQNWLDQNRQRFIHMVNVGISQESDE